MEVRWNLGSRAGLGRLSRNEVQQATPAHGATASVLQSLRKKKKNHFATGVSRPLTR